MIEPEGPALAREAPHGSNLLTCRADHWRGRDRGGVAVWEVKHDPPLPRGGHSQITLRCQVAR